MAAPGTLMSRVSLTFSCKGLMKKDLTSKSDPIVQVFMEDSRNKRWAEVGRTEHIQNSSNPEFSKSIEVDYKFEESQSMKVHVYDIDNETQSLGDDDFLGKIECTLAQIVSSRNYTKKLSYKGSTVDAGTISIFAEELKNSRTEVVLQFEGQHLDKKDFLSKSDPYLEISKANSGGSFSLVHRSEYINDTLDPKWKQISLSTQKLCSDNYDAKLKITCYDYDDDGSHDLIGEFFTSLNEMLADNGANKKWDCINPKKQAKKKSYKNSGIIILSKIKIIQKSSFLQYVMSGCQINFTVGIDFTASNRDPRDPSSLHYFCPNQQNQYVKALMAVGTICQDYDTDKMFPALGFGAKVPPYGEVSFEFPLNFNMSNPYCFGINGVVESYQACLPQIQLYGPTNVAPIVNHVRKFAYNLTRDQPNIAKNYFILLLLTDGVISDMQQTIDAIVDASYLPLSLIIVGVGNADFAQMNCLDCDNEKLRSSVGKEAMRDIVQFVPYRDFVKESPAELARVVLEEIPKQVEEYFGLRGILPLSQESLQQVPLQMPQIS